MPSIDAGAFGVLSAIPGRRVLVIGDPILDDYRFGDARRTCREAPVPAVAVRRRELVPGGAANLAANLAAMGARVSVFGAVGADDDGAALLALLQAAGIDTTQLLPDRERTTVAKRRLVADGQLLLRFDEGGPAPLSRAVRAALRERLDHAYDAADAVVVSDYGYGVLDADLIAGIAARQRVSPRTLVVDARDLTPYAAVPATALKPNADELAALVGVETRGEASGRVAAVLAAGDRIHERIAADVVAVTLDRDGSVVFERGGQPTRTFARPVTTSRACGAGDSYTAALTVALASGASSAQAAHVAQAAAEAVTARDGTSVCSLADLAARLEETTARLRPVDEVRERVETARRAGRRIVFTNGCFDILHRGHVQLLHQAKALGDVLVVGLNTDAGVSRLKGAGRPINKLPDRAEVLAALSCVDYLVAFDSPTAAELVGTLRPDVYVKGGDYLPEMVPEVTVVASYGGEVRILPYLPDRSTTAIISRIRQTPAGSAAGAAGG